MKFLVLSLVVSLISVTHCRVLKPGKCPPMRPSLPPIDLRELNGVWYLLERTPTMSEWRHDCARFQIEPFVEGSALGTLTGWNRVTNKMITISMMFTILANVSGSALYNVESEGTNSTIQTLATDHRSWVIDYHCEEFGRNQLLHEENYWIFSRQKELPNTKMTEIQTALNHFDIDRSLFQLTNQECKD